ncbi:MAG TPA: CHASE3 domain-containing protein [Pirellulales bacterium]|jgi:signal transduction histidine kinase/CheY-like chemotaxis protein
MIKKAADPRPRFVGVGTITAAILLSVLLTYSVVSYWHLRKIATHEAGVLHATDAANSAVKLLSALQDAETGQRGFLLTGEPTYLTPYQAALGAIERSRHELRDALRDQPSEAEHVAELDRPIDAKLAELAEVLRVADGENLEQARRVVAEHRGLHEMDAIRETIGTIEQKISDRRDALREAVDVSIRYAMMSLLIATAFSCGIIAVGFYVIQREIAARRRLSESLQTADRNKNKFLAILGHELRNPLAAIRNAIEVLDLLGNSSEPVDEMHGIIRRQTGVMGRLVDDLLDVSRIAHGKIELQSSQLDLGQLAERTIADTCSAVHGSEVTITLDAPPQPLWVRGDATRLGQAIGNLLHNAVKFSPSGGHVAVSIVRSPGAQARLAIKDQGIGMDQRTLARVFEPFAQGADNGDRSRGGLGLGLPLAKGLIELQGGRIAVESAGPGRGTTFIVTLHCVEYEAPHEGHCGSPQNAPESCRVLIIDDRRDSSFPIQRMLEHTGHEVHVAVDGPSGLAMAQDLELDIVFCDIGLPNGMDGYDVARALRNSPDTAPLFLVALTAYGDEAARRKAHLAGFDRHLTKPASVNEIREILASLPCGIGERDRMRSAT